MKTSINWLLFHLAVADLLVAVLFIHPCILSHFIELPGGVIGNVLCKFFSSGSLGWIAATTSSFLLVVIATERYSATLHPLKKKRSGRSSWWVPVAWVSAILLLMPFIVVTSYDSQNQQCKQHNSSCIQNYLVNQQLPPPDVYLGISLRTNYLVSTQPHPRSMLLSESHHRVTKGN